MSQDYYMIKEQKIPCFKSLQDYNESPPPENPKLYEITKRSHTKFTNENDTY
jgi:hypothetical protein